MRRYECNDNDVNDVNDVTATNNIIKKKNATSAHRQREVLEEGKFVVRQWQAIMEAPLKLVDNSRYIRYGLGVFRTFVAVAILYSDSQERIDTLTTIAVFIMYPIAIATALDACSFFGYALCISDEDLVKESNTLKLNRFFARFDLLEVTI